MSMIKPFSAICLTAVMLCATGWGVAVAEEAAAKSETGKEVSATEDQVHSLVIQVNKDDHHLQDHVLSNIVNLQKHYGMDNIEIEVVAYGPGIWFVTEGSKYADRIKSLLMQNVTFTACGNTLDTIERTDGKRPVLLEDVETTQAGISRLMELQEKGYSYLSP